MLRKSSTAICIFLGAIVLSGSAWAQDGSPPSPWESFEDVKVTTVKPVDLPGTEESEIPAALLSKGTLPRPVTMEQLRETATKLNGHLVEVIVRAPSVRGLRSTELVLRGHAVWVSSHADGGAPVLVTPMHWLRDATSIAIRPTPAHRSGDLPKAERRKLSGVQVGTHDIDESTLTPVTVVTADKHRNLAVLAPEGQPAPGTGIALFPFRSEAATRVYGYSHLLGSALVETRFYAPDDDDEALLFYLQTSYAAILGAPLVSPDGRLIAISSMRHPSDENLTLAIPPGAIRAFLDEVQPDDDKKEDGVTDEKGRKQDRDHTSNER